MAISVPIAGQDITAEDFAIPVVNQLNSIATSPWTQLTLLNSWTHGVTPVRYAKSGNILLVYGNTSNGAVGTTLCTLPVGYRPLYGLSFIQYAWTNLGNGYTIATVNANGNIQLDGGLDGNPVHVNITITIPLF